MAMPLAHGDLTMNHLVSERWPCLTMFEKVRVKRKGSSAKFHWSHFREINNVGVAGVAPLHMPRTANIANHIPRQRHLLAKSGMTTTLMPPLKHMAFQEELRIF